MGRPRRRSALLYPLASVAVLLLAACHTASGADADGGQSQPPPSKKNPNPPIPIAGEFQVTTFGSEADTFALGDCNGDGLLDLMSLSVNGGPAVRIRQSDGTLANPKPIFSSYMRPFNAGTFADLDGDGKQDLILGSDQLSFMKGNGDCTFGSTVTLKTGLTCFVGQIIVTDIDLDGLPDLAATCSGPPAPGGAMDPDPVMVFLARGDGTFDQLDPAVTPLKPGHYSPFGTLWDDIDGDGTRDYMAMLDTGMAWLSWGIPGNWPSFERDNDGSALLATGDAMAIAPLDYDRDGRMDYFVAHFANMPLLMTVSGRTLTNRGPDAYLGLNDTVEGTQLWGTYVLDADFDGWPDLLSVRTSPDYPYSPAPAVFFHNNRDGTFVDATHEVLDYEGDARRLTCGDVLANGRVVCYAQPESNTPPSVIENHIQTVGSWIGVRLRGTVSSPEAEGARVSLSGANPPLMLYYGAGSPINTQHDRAVLLAVGSSASADVDVSWPSGLKQHVLGLMAGTYTTIEEPKVLTVSKRVANADGKDTVEITVDPGQAGLSGPVTIDSDGPGTWLAATAANGSQWTRTLQAPAMPGTTRVIVTIGGQSLAVRPRITFGGG